MKPSMLSISMILGATLAIAPLAEASERERGDRSDRGERRMMWFEHFDVNPEGQVTADSIRVIRVNRLEQQFEQYDLNEDGYITEAEMIEVMERQARERAVALFARLDTANTGLVSKEDFLQRHRMSPERMEEIRVRMENAGESRREALENLEIIIKERRERGENRQERLENRQERRRERSGSGDSSSE
ncbi:MAG: EF-hand domain-containing protein [Idiomarina sp.]|nr:EF-hand domain-containing protein [Idiomarina sp.]